MNPGYLIAEEETYPDHLKEVTDGARNCPGWRDVWEFLREVRALDGLISPLRWLGLGLHDQDSR